MKMLLDVTLPHPHFTPSREGSVSSRWNPTPLFSEADPHVDAFRPVGRGSKFLAAIGSALTCRLAWVAPLLISAALFGGASSAHAQGLDGATVSVGVYTTSSGSLTLESNTATATVGPSVEFPVGSLMTEGSLDVIPVSIDVSDTVIDIDFPDSETAYTAPFNGYIFNFSDLPLPGDITDVSVDDLSTLSPVGVSFTGDSISVNNEGLNIPAGSETVLDVHTQTVPEPSTWTLMAAGMAALLVFHCRRQGGKNVTRGEQVA